MLTLRCVIVLVLTLLSNTGYVSGVRCLECANIQHPEECDKVAECVQGDVCHMQQHITPGGLTQYNVGCMSDVWCRGSYASDVFGRRNTRDLNLVTCVECCKGDYCNLEGCGTTARKPPARGPICFKCKYQGGPGSCRDVVGCDVHEICSIGKSIIYTQFYTTGCATPRQCQTLMQHASHDQCAQCCDGDFCNDNCGETTLVPNTEHPPLPISPITQVHDQAQTSTQTRSSTTQVHASVSSPSTAIPRHHETPLSSPDG